MIRIDVVSPPAEEPVSLAEAKAHLHLHHAAFDDDVKAAITAAREHIERSLGYAIVEQERRATLDSFADVIKLDGGPITVTGVTYIDANGVQQTLASEAYHADTSGGGARLRPAYGTTWPATRGPAAVSVTFAAGHEASKVPASLKAAIKLLVGDLDQNREAATITQGITARVENATFAALLWPHRIVRP